MKTKTGDRKICPASGFHLRTLLVKKNDAAVMDYAPK